MKKKILLTFLLIISACGMGRPMPPTIVTRYSSGLPWSDNSGFGVTTNSLFNVTLFWDVSDVPGARGVEIITARHNSCERDIVFSNQVPMIKSNNDNYLNNLGTLYMVNSIDPGLYYICLKIIKANYSKSPASWPVTLNFTYGW